MSSASISVKASVAGHHTLPAYVSFASVICWHGGRPTDGRAGSTDSKVSRGRFHAAKPHSPSISRCPTACWWAPLRPAASISTFSPSLLNMTALSPLANTCWFTRMPNSSCSPVHPVPPSPRPGRCCSPGSRSPTSASCTSSPASEPSPPSSPRSSIARSLPSTARSTVFGGGRASMRDNASSSVALRAATSSILLGQCASGPQQPVAWCLRWHVECARAPYKHRQLCKHGRQPFCVPGLAVNRCCPPPHTPRAPPHPSTAHPSPECRQLCDGARQLFALQVWRSSAPHLTHPSSPHPADPSPHT